MKQDDLDMVVVRTGHERLRELTSDANPDVAQRDAYRDLVTRLALGEPNPPPEYPPLAKQAVSALMAAGRFVASGLKTVDEAEYERRLAICKACDQYDAEKRRCRVCGCRTEYKLRMAAEHCPLPEPKW